MYALRDVCLLLFSSAKPMGFRPMKNNAVDSGNRPTGNATREINALHLGLFRRRSPTPARPALHRAAAHTNPRRTTKRKVPPDRTWPSWERHGSAQCVADLHCRCRQQLSGLGLNGLCSTLSTVPVSCNASTTESRGIPSSLFGREDASLLRSGSLLIDPWCSVLSVMPTTLCEAIGLWARSLVRALPWGKRLGL